MSEKSTIDEVGFQGFKVESYALVEREAGCGRIVPVLELDQTDTVRGYFVSAEEHRASVEHFRAQYTELQEALEVETSRVEALEEANANLKSRLDEEKRMVMALAGVLEEERRGRNGNARLQVATAALQGLLANAEGVGGRTPLVSCDDGYGFDCKGLARLAVEQADALLEELGLGARDGIQHKDD